MTATDSAATPPPGRPVAMATSTTTAIAAGAHDARLRRHEHDESEQRQRARRRPGATATPAQRRDGERRRRHDRAVRTGHRGQVAERARLHRRVELGADRGRVADRESGHQCAAVSAESRRGVGEAGSQADRPSEPRGRARDECDLAVDGQPERALLGRGHRCDPGGESETTSDGEHLDRNGHRDRDRHGSRRPTVDGDQLRVHAIGRPVARVPPRRRTHRTGCRHHVDDDVDGLARLGGPRECRRGAVTEAEGGGRGDEPRCSRQHDEADRDRSHPHCRRRRPRCGPRRDQEHGDQRTTRCPRPPMRPGTGRSRHRAPRPRTMPPPTRSRRAPAAGGRALRARPDRRGPRTRRRRCPRPRAAGRRS